MHVPQRHNFLFLKAYSWGFLSLGVLGVLCGPSGPGPRYQRPGPVGCADGGSATRSVETGRQRRIRRRAGHTTIEASTMQPRHSVSRQPQLGFLRQPNLRTLSVSSVLSVVKIRRLLPQQSRVSPRRSRLFRPWSAQWPCRRQPAQPHSENPGVTGGPSGPGPRYQRPRVTNRQPKPAAGQRATYRHSRQPSSSGK
jgi:hypothetical protein